MGKGRVRGKDNEHDDLQQQQVSKAASSSSSASSNLPNKKTRKTSLSGLVNRDDEVEKRGRKGASDVAEEREGERADCPHLKTTNVEAVVAGSGVLVPDEWKCGVRSCTQGVQGLWCCLHCPFLGCSGDCTRDHALQHYNKTKSATKKHCVWVDISERRAFCFECDSYVVDDNDSDGKLAQLFDKLEKVSSGEFVFVDGRLEPLDGKPTPFSKKFEHLDRQDLAWGHYRHRMLRKYWNVWVGAVQKKKLVVGVEEEVRQRPVRVPKMLNLVEQGKGRDDDEEVDDDNVVDDAVFAKPAPPAPKQVASSSSESSSRRSSARNAAASAAAAASAEGPKKPPRIMLDPTISKVVLPGKTGLRNLGNTCFINSVLQCLSNLSELRDWLINSFMDSAGTPIQYNNVTLWRRATVDCLNAISSNVSIDKTEISLVVELHNIFRVMWSGRWLVVTPFALLDALWKFVPRFRGYAQQDAQEFFTYLLDRVNVELTEAMKKQQKPLFVAPAPVSLRGASLNGNTSSSFASGLLPPSSPSTPTASSSSSASARSIIMDTFEGSFASEVKCSSCRHVSRMSESFLDVELDVMVQSVARRRQNGSSSGHEATSINECLASFARWEEIKDYKCDNCSRVTKASKRMFISRLPRVLCLVLKRFCFTSSGQLAKNDAVVTFPLYNLDVSAACDVPKGVEPPPVFDLRSVIVHHGVSLRKGHYTAMCLNDELGWFHFNDAKVTQVEEKTVENSQAYMLFYSMSE